MFLHVPLQCTWMDDVEQPEKGEGGENFEALLYGYNCEAEDGELKVAGEFKGVAGLQICADKLQSMIQGMKTDCRVGQKVDAVYQEEVMRVASCPSCRCCCCAPMLQLYLLVLLCDMNCSCFPVLFSGEHGLGRSGYKINRHYDVAGHR